MRPVSTVYFFLLLVLGVHSGLELASESRDEPVDGTAKVPGQPIKSSTPYNVMVQVEWIKLKHTEVTGLLLNRPLKTEASELRMEVQALVEQGRAEVAETDALVSRSACRGKIQGVAEWEYGQATVVPWISPSWSTAVPKGGKAQKIFWPPSFYPGLRNYGTTKIGTTLEVDPLAGGDFPVIDLTVSADLVEGHGYDSIMKIPTPQGERSILNIPRIYRSNIQSALTLRSGEYVLAAVLAPSNGDGEADLEYRYMVFVRSSIMKW